MTIYGMLCNISYSGIESNMEIPKEMFNIDWDSLEIDFGSKKVKYPLLRIKISGDPSLSMFIKMMRSIESFTEDFEKEYISLTDFTELVPNKVTESLLSISSNRYLRTVLFVSNKAQISFVLIGENSKLSVLKKKLMDVNNKEKELDYSYDYHFIEKESDIIDIVKKSLVK
jgi:hypothetical protein